MHHRQDNPGPGEQFKHRLAAIGTRAWAAYGKAFARKPTSTLALTLAALALPFVNAAGIAGGMRWPLFACLPVGIWMLARQVEALRDWRQRRGSRVKNLLSLVSISAINMLSLAAGAAALDANGLGQRLIQRQLAPIVAAAVARADELDRAASESERLAAYSSDRASTESARDDEWVATCPNSAGDGPGDISTWRENTAIAARADAEALRSRATAARAAATAAERARTAYFITTHDDSMRTIGAEIARIDQAIMAAGDAAMAGRLRDLASATSPAGICPDAPLLASAQSLLATIEAVPTVLRFSPPQKPDEAVAVADLMEQMTRLPSGDHDFSPYLRYLALSPVLDLILMSMLAGLWGAVTRNLHHERLRHRGLGDSVTEVQLDAAYEAAAGDPAWLAYQASEKQRRGPWTLERLRIAEEDAAALAHARDMVGSRVWREGGTDSEGNIVFVIRPAFRKVLWDQLVRRHLATGSGGQPSAAPMLSVVEG